jgi:phosphodiesterase/alkaline phosphatase D-like protein
MAGNMGKYRRWSFLVSAATLLAALLSPVISMPPSASAAPTCEPVDGYARRFVSAVDAGGSNDAGDQFGSVVASGDFNADGFADLVVGAPYDGVGGASSGAVYVYPGSAAGTGAGRRYEQTAAGGSNEAGDRFGGSLAVGDFNRDGYADLAVGTRGEDLSGITDTGAVFLFMGSGSGLTTGRWFDQPATGGANEANDKFGFSVGAGDLNADGYADLAIGTPNEAPGADPASGAVGVLLGSASGLSSGYFRTQLNAGGGNEAGDEFGSAVAVGDITGDGRGDLIVGAPNEAPGSDPAGGAVFVLPGPTLTGGYYRTQANAGGANEAGDRFGAALAAADLTRDGFAEFIVGAPLEDISNGANGTDAGAVFVFRGTSGPAPTGYLLTEYAGGDIPELGDQFGTALAAGDVDGDGHPDLVVGAPAEGPDAEPAGGAVFLFGASPRDLDVARRITQPQLQASSEAGDRFGAALATGRHGSSGHTDLVIGAPGEALPGQPASGIATVASGLISGVAIGGMVGATTDTTARVWARGTRAAALRVQHRPSGTATWTTSAAATFNAARDHTAAVTLTGLAANTTYEYRLAVECDVDPLSRATFRTLDPAGAPGTFRFAYGADLAHPSNFGGRSYAAFDHVAAANPDFMILGGDQMYADASPVATTKPAYEKKYRDNFGQSHFGRFAAKYPTVMMWDDHEIRNDWSSGTIAPYPDARAAYDAYQGLRNPAPRVAGELYYSFQVGQAGFYVLDTRTHRSPNGATDNASKTMLGATQKANLKAWLSASTAKFKFLVSSVPWNNYGTTGSDSWRGFTTERNELFRYIRDNAIGGVVLVSGDQHWSGAFKLTNVAPYSFYEFMPTPLATGARTAPAPAPGIIWHDQSGAQVFGLFDVDTTISPARLTVEFRSATNQLLCRIRIDANGALLARESCT